MSGPIAVPFNPLAYLGGGPTPLVPIIIAELSGSFRPIVLFGSAMPREGGETTLGGAQRGKRTYYAGNPEPTTQTLGPEEEPIRFNGMLEDRRLGTPGTAMALMALIDSVRESGRLCSFSWGPILRTVQWGSARFRPAELTRIAYEIELHVISRGVGTVRRIVKTLGASPQLDGIVSAVSGAAAAFDSLPVAVGISALGTASQALTASEALVESAERDLEGLSVPTPAVSLSALTKLRAARDETAVSEAGTRSIDWRAAGEPSLALVADVALPVLDARHQVVDAAVELQRRTPIVEKLAQQDESGTMLYTAGQGDTLRRISQRFYGTADRWGEILTDNALATPELAAGPTLRLRNVPEPDKTFGSRPAFP